MSWRAKTKEISKVNPKSLAILASLVGAVSLLFASPASAAFGIAAFDGAVSDSGGGAFTQAGGHPFAASVSFDLNQTTDSHGRPQPDGGGLKEAVVDLPPGFVGKPTVMPTCPNLEGVRETNDATKLCPINSIVGIAQVPISVQGAIETHLAPVFNMKAAAGVPAEFAFAILGFPVVLGAELRSDGDYGISIRARWINQGATAMGSTVTLWGNPPSPVHDDQRCGLFPLPLEVVPIPMCIGPPNTPIGPNPSTVPQRAFLTNPTACPPQGTGLPTSIRVESWQGGTDAGTVISHKAPGYPAPPDTWGPPQGPTGCEQVPFDPVVKFEPTSTQADSPTGLDVEISVPSAGLEDPDGIAQSDLKKAVVTLPAGMSVNPSSAAGLGSCSPQQLAAETADSLPGAGCPNDSKIGTVEVQTPLLEERLSGSVFLAKQNDNPFNSLLAIYIVAKSKERGVVIKLPGRVEPDPATGHLTTTFDDNPQLPFSDLQVHFFGGSAAPLINPPACGTYAAEADLSPWARPDTPDGVTDYFQITSGPNGAPCPASGSFEPGFEAGTLTPLAGLFSPLVVHASRPDGSEPLTGINLSLPPGLLGKLAGIPYCSDAGIAEAGARNQPGQGAQEIASPSCPAASQIGSVDVAAGAGPSPYHVQGKAYLAGPYRGAPLSLVVITPAVAGPFDLGVVAVRAALRVDPITAQISAESDPIPQILQGIPLKIRSISVKADKPDFTLNPTNCEPMSLSGTLFGPTALAPVSNRFQVGACKALDFAPKLALRVFGKTNRNSKPRFRAVLQTRPGEANISRAQVNLPHSEFLEQNHIKTICTRVQWNAGAGHGSQCPQGSVYGYARAFTPLLDQPLQGPVYLRSNGGERKLPDLVASLNGQIDVELQGKVDAGKNHGLRNTFEVVPDAPVSKFVLTMAGGKKGLLVNSENLCSKKAKTRAIVRFTGQNGAVHAFKPKVANRCGKKRQRRHGKHRSRD